MVFLVVGIHVDQLHKKIGVGTGGAEIEFGHDLAAQRHIFGQHVGFEHQHIGAGGAANRWSSDMYSKGVKPVICVKSSV